MREAIGDALRRGSAVLAAAGIDAPAREARLLLAHALGADPTALLDPAQIVRTTGYDAAVARRAAHEPMAFIRGRQGFWTLDLAVSPATLIPRADSETLIEALRDAFPPPAAPARILDLGTGTGALLLAALSLFPSAVGLGVDRIAEAAALAAANARDNGLADRALFVVADWAAPIACRFDAILANPPYIPGGVIAALMPEIADHEPRSALAGGEDGLDAYRRILPSLASLLTRDGVAIFEIGADQAGPFADLARRAGLGVTAIRPDLGGNPRAIVLGGLCR